MKYDKDSNTLSINFISTFGFGMGEIIIKTNETKVLEISRMFFGEGNPTTGNFYSRTLTLSD